MIKKEKNKTSVTGSELSEQDIILDICGERKKKDCVETYVHTEL